MEACKLEKGRKEGVAPFFKRFGWFQWVRLA
jgi:hypothetical protein